MNILYVNELEKTNKTLLKRVEELERQKQFAVDEAKLHHGRMVEALDELTSIKQAISDPENQPSQYGTITLEGLEKMQEPVGITYPCYVGGEGDSVRVRWFEGKRPSAETMVYTLPKDNAWFGQGNNKKTEVFELALEMV